MTTEIQSQGGLLPQTKNFESIEGFAKALNQVPPKNEVQINKAANNSKYLPISFVQMKLDEMFFGLWETVNFQHQVIANEIVARVELRVFHPTAKMWITRTGVASVLIQQKKGSAITDIGAKHKNTLVKDFPHLEAECLKNAAKKLGKAFGRDLNREHTDDHNGVIEQSKEAATVKDELETQLANCDNIAELNLLFNNYASYSTNDQIRQLFMNRRKELQKQA